MKKMLLMTMIVMGLSFAIAAEADVTVEAGFATKEMLHGANMYDDVASWSASINIDLSEGFYAGTKYTMPGSGGNAYGSQNGFSRSDATRLDYWVGYKNQTMVGEALQADYDLSYKYYDHGSIATYNGGVRSKISGADADIQELALDIKFPNLCPLGMLVPHYNVAYMFEPSGSEAGMFGFVQTVGVGYDFVVADMPMNATADFVYDGGAITDKNDWTRAVLGLSTEFEVAGGKLVPGVYYQHAFLDPIDAWGDLGAAMDDEFYATLTYSMKF